MIIIYILRDPETKEIRYCGKTVETLKRRLTKHLCKQNLSRNNHTCNWLNSLKKRGLKPIIEEVDHTYDNDEWENLEKKWIKDLQEGGHKLTNTTLGGESGCLGYKHSQAAKASIALLNSRPKSQEWIDNVANAVRAAKAVPILQFSLDGELIRKWDSVCYAATYLNDPTRSKAKNITACCKGKRVTAYGFKWTYEVIEGVE